MGFASCQGWHKIVRTKKITWRTEKAPSRFTVAVKMQKLLSFSIKIIRFSKPIKNDAQQTFFPHLIINLLLPHFRFKSISNRIYLQSERKLISAENLFRGLALMWKSLRRKFVD